MHLPSMPEPALIAAIVPAHNEEEHLGACVRSLVNASRHPALRGEPVEIVVVLDSCTDASRAVAAGAGARCLSVDARNVGAARARGAEHAIGLGARWLAFTDADSVVEPDWFVAQLGLDSDAVCGTVAVRDWGSYGERMRRHYDATYTDADGHRHIHGANLGVSAPAYRAVGGFRPLESSEDVALVEALERHGAKIAWSAAPRVFTSARRVFRAPLGFGATLLRIELESQRGTARDGA
jgi:glycosyltransferase involved in cell wall biosynthesis